jgi:molybdate transport system ATP-binding protein
LAQRHPGARGGSSPPRAPFIGVNLDRVGLSLDGRPVLRGVSWTIQPAQRWVLTGHNGAGKTVLLKLVAGDLWPTAAQGRREYFYRGERFDQPYGVREEIAYLGAERQDRYERYGWNHRVESVVGSGLHRTDIPLDRFSDSDQRRIGRLLRRLRLQGLARRRFLTLSYGERRLVLLARALAASPKLLLLDELFNGLDAVNRAHATHCLGLVSRSGLPWVLSSHREEEVPSWVTHRCELEAGVIRAQGPVAAGQARLRARARRSRGDAVQRAMVHRRFNGAAARLAAGEPALPPGPALIRVLRASIWREGTCVLRGLSLELHAGECWVVHGANGSGKSSCLQMLYGDLCVARGGHIERDGITPGTPLAQFRRRVGLVAPELQAQHPRGVRVDEVVASGLHATISYGDTRLASGSPRTRVRVRRALHEVGAAALERRLLRTLSYGQLRRVLFARALVGNPELLLLDEPYTGLDAATRARLRARVEHALRSGVTVVIATHHEDDCPVGTTHELQLGQGRVLYRGPLRGATQ